MGRRNDIDWEKIEKLYRLGQLSLREIARQHGVEPSSITRRAKKYGWTKSAAEDVRQATEALLLSNGKATAPTREDIDLAAQTNLGAVRRHRTHLGKLATVAERLVDTLMALTEKREPEFLFELGAKESWADALVKCAQATARFIPLERQALNIDERATPESSIIAALKEIRGIA